MLPHYIEEHGYLPPGEFLSIFDAEVEAVSNRECDDLFREHDRHLADNPTRTDILVALYDVQVFWDVADFADLIAFRKFLEWNQGPGPFLRTDRLSKNDLGYCLNLESRDPAESFGEIHKRFERHEFRPKSYRYRLVHLDEPWTVVEGC
ncbi:hypothetical protein [Aeoliella sp.]|uniref:hypothetical protein n=1 Tax=Aeoliella sp. TaxID=2795800 RepID=UPI003CCBF304